MARTWPVVLRCDWLRLCLVDQWEGRAGDGLAARGWCWLSPWRAGAGWGPASRGHRSPSLSRLCWRGTPAPAPGPGVRLQIVLLQRLGILRLRIFPTPPWMTITLKRWEYYRCKWPKSTSLCWRRRRMLPPPRCGWAAWWCSCLTVSSGAASTPSAQRWSSPRRAGQ